MENLGIIKNPSKQANTMKSQMTNLSDLTSNVVGMIFKMGFFVVGSILLLALALYLIKSKIRDAQSGNQWNDKRNKTSWTYQLNPRYRDRFKFLDTWETDLYLRLVSGMPGLIVFAQVSLPQMLYIKGIYERQQMRQVGHMSVDFLICRKERNDIKMVAAIELNGASHERADRRKMDAFKEKVLQEAGIPLIVYDIEDIPGTEDIKKHIASALVARKQYEAERDANYRKNMR
jgi:hypothetical protein